MIVPTYIFLALLLAYIILVVYFVNRHLHFSRLAYLRNQDLDEEINALTEEVNARRQIHFSLEQKIVYYNTLREITNKIQNLSLQEMCQHLMDYIFYLLGRNKGTCLLYLVDMDQQNLNLFMSKKEERHLVIKQKQGDIFDQWVIRRGSSLLVKDVKNDFRFDLEKTEYKPTRPVASVLSAPLKVEKKFLGIIRLDNKKEDFYSQDDLRFLDTICNIGALGLENALLFKYTQELAIKDSLTGLFTKHHYLDSLKQRLQRIKRRPYKNLSVLMIDIDKFKDYNDRYGHIAGDMVLRNLGQLFHDFFSQISTSLVCRFGGEEFSAFFSDISKAESKKLAEDLRHRVEKERFFLRRKEMKLTISIGLATLTFKISTAQDLIFKADAALYRAKQKGRNQVCVA